jgi:hypothetical protein
MMAQLMSGPIPPNHSQSTRLTTGVDGRSAGFNAVEAEDLTDETERSTSEDVVDSDGVDGA